MLSAKTTILVHFQTIGIVFLVLPRIIIALFAFGASERNLNAHIVSLPLNAGWFFPKIQLF